MKKQKRRNSRAKVVPIAGLKAGGENPLFLIAGPCVLEGKDMAMEHAAALVDICGRLDIPLIFKSSYDKANRSSIKSFRGPGLKKGLKILSAVKKKFDIPVTSDVHTAQEAKEAAEVLDMIQIPALLCRQTDIITAAARTKRPVNVKKGQFLSPYDVKNIIAKITACSNDNIILTERGSMFGYNNLINDMRAIPIMAGFGYPVVYDASHSVQLPGASGSMSAGKREFIPYLARAAVAAGCHGLFIETHLNPARAACDGPNMLAVKKLAPLLRQAKKIREIIVNKA